MLLSSTYQCCSPSLGSRSNMAGPQWQVPVGDAFNLWTLGRRSMVNWRFAYQGTWVTLMLKSRRHTSKDPIPSKLTSSAQATRTVPSHTARHTPFVSTATLAGIQEPLTPLRSLVCELDFSSVMSVYLVFFYGHTSHPWRPTTYIACGPYGPSTSQSAKPGCRRVIACIDLTYWHLVRSVVLISLPTHSTKQCRRTNSSDTWGTSTRPTMATQVRL